MLVILDKDGTLIQPKGGRQFVESPTDQEILPGVADKIAQLKAVGATLVIASNQGGVAAGHKSLESAIAEMLYCLQLLPEVERAFFCPDWEGQTFYDVHRSNIDTQLPLRMIGWEAYKGIAVEDLIGQWRKPNPGMLIAATRLYPMISEIYMVGDRPEDQQAAQAADVAFIDAEAWRNGAVSIAPGVIVA
jgi:D-glycero-D-manno-heptose 1,7-bisphosphate phosphatase